VELAAGVHVKNYILEAQLGIGSSGDVWRANDGEKTVAIKFMNEQLLQSAAAQKHRQRLEREVQALGRLKHPNVPALYDYDLDFPRPYLVMEYITGESYDAFIASGEMLSVKVKKRLENILTIARTLDAAHKLGIVHRDVKPANIKSIEKPYLLDFSVALETSDVMYTQQYVGTGMYMAPPDGPPDELADNFSFALVAYEILFGSHPIFTAETIGKTAVHTRILAEQRLRKREWRLPSRILPRELPGDLRGADLQRLDDIFEKGLGPRGGRYTDLVQFAEDLKRAVLVPSNKPYLDKPAPPPEKPASIPSADRFTVIEVGKGGSDTNLEREAETNNRRKLMVIGLVVVLIIIIIIILLIPSASVNGLLPG
jgi:serine/threonine protein kinase